MKIAAIEAKLIDLAWAAGFIDGEGCITSTNTGVLLKVNHTHLPSLEFLQKLFGGYINSHVGSKKKAWVWSVHGDDADRCLKLLSPYLFEKSPQAEIAIQILSMRTGRGIKPTPEAREVVESLKQRLSQLKK